MNTVLMWLLKRKWLIAIAVILLATGGYYWYRQTQASQQTYVTVRPELADLTESLSVSGQVDAHEKADIKFAAPARLQWVGVKEGQEVRKYQTVATQDTRSLKKQLQLSLNNFAKQFITHDELLAENDFYNKPDLDLELRRILEKAQYDLNNAVIDVELQDLAIKLASLYTPINGIVTKVSQPYAGASVGVTDIIQVVNPDTIFFSVIVDEADIAKIKPYQSVNIVLDAYPDSNLTGAVESIDFAPSVSETGGNGYKVSISLPQNNDDLRYKLGMNGTTEIILNKKSQVLSIPIDSLVSRDNKNYVDVLENGKPVRKEITIGTETDTRVEVVSGLTPEDAVILPQSS